MRNISVETVAEFSDLSVDEFVDENEEVLPYSVRISSDGEILNTYGESNGYYSHQGLIYATLSAVYRF